MDRTPGARLLGTACLRDWSLSFHKRSKDASGKCTVQPGSDGVHFALFEMTAHDKLVLDAVEGLGNGYDELHLDIPAFGECFSYIAQGAFIDESLLPYDWYKALVLAGARFHGFPADYTGWIESVSARPDPDPERHVDNWEIVRRASDVSLASSPR